MWIYERNCWQSEYVSGKWRGSGFAGSRAAANHGRAWFPCNPHPCCWATSVGPFLLLLLLLLSLSPSPSLLPYFPSLLLLFHYLLKLLPTVLSFRFLIIQNVCSCCFLWHRQGGQRRMPFLPSNLCVLFTRKLNTHQNKQDRLVAKRTFVLI